MGHRAMSGTAPAWLAGRRALVVGGFGGVAETLSRHGASVAGGDPGAVDVPAIADAFAWAEARVGGGIDILVHGGTQAAQVAPENVSLDTWRASFSADIDGRFLYAAEFARRRLAAGRAGAILLLMPAPGIGPGRAAALTAQGALDNLVKSLAVEWARDGIRVNAIAASAAQGHLAAYLVSDYAAYVTGCVMGVDET
jgi:NAD(P)-dependent dehydrogenase (short-subunit alcohol dehydrogenase family)